jgi:hypothetical protein
MFRNEREKEEKLGSQYPLKGQLSPLPNFLPLVSIFYRFHYFPVAPSWRQSGYPVGDTSDPNYSSIAEEIRLTKLHSLHFGILHLSR